MCEGYYSPVFPVKNRIESELMMAMRAYRFLTVPYIYVILQIL